MASLPYNIRVNVNLPFPARVSGAAGIKVTKSNGIWTIRPDFSGLAQAVPPQSQFGVTFLEIWNSQTGVYSTISFATLAALAGQTVNSTNVTAAMSPYTPADSDTVLFVDSSAGPVEIDLKAAIIRNGIALVVKDVKGSAATNNITIKPLSGETIDGYTNATPLVINANYGGFNLFPSLLSYVIAP